MSFHWICFIILLCLEICSFTAILVCFSLFYSVYVQKKKNKKKTKKREEKKKKKNYINPCACVYIRYQYQYSLSMYMDL